MWFIAQAGELFCFFTYQIIGKYVYLPFFWLASWPNMLVQPIYPKTMPEWMQRWSWPISCGISLIGWLILSAMAALIAHRVLASRRQDVVRRHDCEV